VTAMRAILAGGAVLLAARFRSRVMLPAIIGLLVVTGGVTAHPAIRGRVVEGWQAMRDGDWDRLLTYRLGPWGAALEMVRARPLRGWGPGAFGAEFVPHRLAAEVRFRTRLVNPFLAGAYVEAHSDYLQGLAELGIPTALAAMAAAAIVLGGLARAAWRREHPDRPEAILLLALLVAGAAAALTWFPLERPITAVPLLLAAGPAGRTA